MKTKFALFLGGYWVYCFLLFSKTLIDITAMQSPMYLFSGVMTVGGLFLSAMWIEELLNEN